MWVRLWLWSAVRVCGECVFASCACVPCVVCCVLVWCVETPAPCPRCCRVRYHIRSRMHACFLLLSRVHVERPPRRENAHAILLVRPIAAGS